MNQWTIVGAGAIGGLVACQLHQHGIGVQIVERTPSQGDNKSLAIKTEGRTSNFDIPLYRHNTPIEHILLATKSYQTQEAVGSLATVIAPHATIIVLQNGLGSADWLNERFPNATILGATTTHGAYREDPCTIVHAGKGSTWMGPFSDAHYSKAKDIYNHWHQAGVDIEWDANIEQRLWIKLAINCAINPLTAIHNCKNGELLQRPNALSDIERIIHEFEAVYLKKFASTTSVNLMNTVIDVATKTAENSSSMRQDVLNHRRTEIEAINGYLVRQAESLGIECALNRKMVRAIESMNKG